MHRPASLQSSPASTLRRSAELAPPSTPKAEKATLQVGVDPEALTDAGRVLAKTTAPTTGKKDLASGGSKLEDSALMLRFSGEKEPASWDQALVKSAKELRADAAKRRWSGQDVASVAREFTTGTQGFFKGVLDRALAELAADNGGALPADFPKDYTILGCGSFSRGEMCPRSDMDIILMAKDAEEAPKLKPLADKLAKLFGEVKDAKGGFNIDDVSGQIQTPETFAPKSDYAFETRPLHSSSAEGAKLYDRFRQQRDHAISAKIAAPKGMTLSKAQLAEYGVGRPVALNSLAKVVDSRWKSVEKNYGDKSYREVNIKELQAFVSNAAVRLAEYHDATGRGTVKHLDGSTIDRLTSLAGETGTDIGKLLSAKAPSGRGTLAEALSADYRFLMDQRYNTHTAHRREHDKFTPNASERARVDAAIQDFAALHTAVRELVKREDRVR